MSRLYSYQNVLSAPYLPFLMGTPFAKISQDSERRGSSEGKESACNAGDWGLIPGLGKSPGEGNGYPYQYSCLENSMDRRAWPATVHGVSKSGT